MGTPHLAALHPANPDESGIWRARFAGRLACSDARRATCRPSLASAGACLVAARVCAAPLDGSERTTPEREDASCRCEHARAWGRVSTRVIGAAPREALARGFWRYDVARGSLRWVVG
ncbi:MAG: hypothetical protein U0326_33375 [Polyangiales bacterium]